MSIRKTLAAAFLTLSLTVSGMAHAEVIAARGVATIPVTGSRPKPEQRDQAIAKARENALDRYIAENNPAKQRIYDDARGSILSSIGEYVLGTTVLAEQTDTKAKTYTVTVRADINSNTLENRLSDSAGQSPAREGGRDILLVFVSRTPSSIQSFDDRVYSRVDNESEGGCKTKGDRKTSEGERVTNRSVSTSDNASANASYACKTTDITESGGSTTRKADKVIWAVGNSADFDQQITGTMADSGYNLVPAEYIEKFDLSAVRADYARDDELSQQTLRSTVAAAKAAHLTYIVLGTMTVEMPDRDPVSGNVRVFASINARLLDISGAFPRPVAAIGPVQYAGLGPSEAVARTQATTISAREVAKVLLDRLAVKGVR
ncbi:hypothetical protein [Asticcacaulis benevestitus]|uniref:Flagellar assembly protein T N-terminal domain-containing protein n=1 Tax=Asticcacaulis benevestitus DSM 16100 = ATCC BAA-896 TaxID=1121022 RepID=V4PN19_9CAUL|nr:hypothetical protein [Asticcacaulis benevestitus]ESQ88669.1 hypothetical protein ABENE_15620 [Asticcacaulis benevestitus DSM 16100 = ATCC BAA-896]